MTLYADTLLKQLYGLVENKQKVNSVTRLGWFQPRGLFSGFGGLEKFGEFIT